MTTLKLSLFFISVLLFSTCTKEATQSDQTSETYFKQYGTPIGEMNSYAGKTSDGFFMVGTSNTNDQLTLSKCNKFGHLLWEKVVPVDRPFYFPKVLQLSDGSFLINDEGNPIVTRGESDGSITYSRWFDPGLTSDIYIYSPLVESTNKMLYVAYSGGASTSGLNRNYISEINPTNGLETRYFRYFDADFNGKIQSMSIAKADGATFWVWGNLYDNSPWSWADPWKLYTAKIEENRVIDVHIYDTKDNSKQEEANASIITYNDDIVMITNKIGMLLAWGDVEAASSVFKVRRIDLNLSDKWEQEISIGASSAMPISIEETSTGDLIIVGTCVENYKNEKSGFITKLDGNGNEIETKIFNLGQAHSFYDAVYLENEGCFFTGYIDNFGKDLEEANRFYLKTDKDFNY